MALGDEIVTANQNGHLYITDNTGVWTNDGRAFDGLTSTYADTTDAQTTKFLIGAGNDISHGSAIILGVEFRAYVQSVAGDIGIHGPYYNGISRGTQGFNNTSAAWLLWKDATEPSGGWTKAKVDALETRFWRSDGSGELRAFASQIRVTYLIVPRDVPSQDPGWTDISSTQEPDWDDGSIR